MRSSDPSGSLSASKSMIREGGFSPRACIGASFSASAARSVGTVEDEIERGVEQPARAHRRLDEPFWKLEGCERQLSDLVWRIVLCRHGDSPTCDTANRTALHAASQHDQAGDRVDTIGCARRGQKPGSPFRPLVMVKAEAALTNGEMLPVTVSVTGE